MLTDSHTHLNSPQLFPDCKDHIRDFLAVGGVGLSIIGTNLEDSITAIEICRDTLVARPNNGQLYIGATIGYHPEFARDCDISKLEELILRDRGQGEIPPLASNLDSKASRGQKDTVMDSKAQSGGGPVIIGIGEIGTDLYREPYHEFYEEQKKAFHDQCILAKKYNLPIIIHSRNDFAGSMEVLQSFIETYCNTSSNGNKDVFKIYFHCRGYTVLELETLHNLIKHNQNLELYIGFCGNISYPKAQDLRDSFQYCLDNNMNVLIETDAPYLAAQAIRGQQNTPAKIIHTYEYISDYFHIPMEELQKKTHDNFMSLYYPMSVIAISI